MKERNKTTTTWYSVARAQESRGPVAYKVCGQDLGSVSVMLTPRSWKIHSSRCNELSGVKLMGADEKDPQTLNYLKTSKDLSSVKV